MLCPRLSEQTSFGHNSAQSPANFNMLTLSLTSKFFSDLLSDIKQLSCVKVPNLIILSKYVWHVSIISHLCLSSDVNFSSFQLSLLVVF